MKSVMIFLFGFLFLSFAAVYIMVCFRSCFGCLALDGNDESVRNTRIQFGFFGKISGRKRSQPEKKKDIPEEDLTKKQQRAEFEQKRAEYESRYTNIRPAKRMSGQFKADETVQEVPRNGEKSSRVQQYCADEINMRGQRKAVDREAEIKKAKNLQRQLEEEEERYYGGSFRTPLEPKTVDREAELRKARELQKQLEEEEEQHYREFMMKGR